MEEYQRWEICWFGVLGANFVMLVISESSVTTVVSKFDCDWNWQVQLDCCVITCYKWQVQVYFELH